MKPYIFGTRNGITIFDLTVTMRRLAEASNFLRDTAAAGDKVLFVGAKRQAQEIVKEIAESTGMFYMCDRWLGGTLTNNRVVLSRVGKMKSLQRMETDGVFKTMPKKEVARARREMEKLQRTLSGIADMQKLPTALVIVDVGREDIAVREAAKLGIPVVGLVDSNCDPDSVDFVIPGNDDALRAIKVIMETLRAAIMEGLRLSGRADAIPAPRAPAAKVDDATDVGAEDAAPDVGEDSRDDEER